MFASKPRKETKSKWSIQHFSPAINLALLLSLMITSCVPSQKTTVPAQEEKDIARVTQSQTQPNDEDTAPVFTHPEPRVAERPNQDIQDSLPPVLSGEPDQYPQTFTHNGEDFDPQAYAQARYAEVTAEMDRIKEQVQIIEPAPNPVRTVEPRAPQSEEEKDLGILSDHVFAVTTLDDHDDGICNSDCSLREAIYAANDSPGEDTIIFQVSGTIHLENSLPYLTDTGGLKIESNGQEVELSEDYTNIGFRFTSFLLSAVQTPPPGCDIYSEGPMTISGTYESYNICVLGALTISNATLTNSTAWTESTLTVIDSTLNESLGFSADGALAVSNSIFNNSDLYTGETAGVDINYSSFNGSNVFGEAGTMSISHSVFNTETSAFTGDASMTVSDSIFTEDSSAFNRNSTLLVTNSDFSDQSAAFNSSGTFDIIGGTFSSSSWASSLGEMTIEQSEFSTRSLASTTNALTLTEVTVSENSWMISDGAMTISQSSFSSRSTADTLSGLTVSSTIFSDSMVHTGIGSIHSLDSLAITNSTLVGSYSGPYPNAQSGQTSMNTVPLGNSVFSGSQLKSEVHLTVFSDGTLTSTNSTLWGTTLNSIGSLSLYNTILSNNSTCSKTVTTGSHSLIDASGVNTCGLNNGIDGNIVGSDPKLRPLYYFADGTPSYFELDDGSPAIDAGDNSVCATQPVNNTSQNGLTRPQGERCDIGSYEAPPLAVYLGSILNNGQSKTTIQAHVESDGNISGLSCVVECEGDPINTLTGTFSFTLTDLGFSTSAGELVFQRSYSSDSLDPAGVLGPGWTHNHEAKLIFPADPGGMEDHILFQSVLGNQYLFKIESDGSYSPGLGVIASLIKSSTEPISYTLTTSQQATFRFDEDGRLAKRQDAQGHAFNYEYDTQDRLTKVSGNGGFRFIQVGYDALGRIINLTDHAGRQVSYNYDAAGDLVSSIDLLGQTWTYLYDSSHHLTQVKDPAGKETVRTEYDLQGRANRQYDGEGNLIVSITYNINGSTIIYDAFNKPEEHQYNAQNVAIETMDRAGRTETREFNGDFRPISIANNANQSLEMTWSTGGVNLLSKIDPAGNRTDYTYDLWNNLTSVIDPRDFLTTYTYDEVLLTGSTDALNGQTSYTYTPEGYLESVTDTLGRVTFYTYDSFGQRSSMTDPSGNTWEYTYDPLGRLIDTIDPRDRVTHNEYNAAGKLVRVTQNYDPARPKNDENQYNIVTEYQYDARGNQTAVTDTYNRTTQYIYDHADRLIQTIDPAANITTNTYDAAGRLIATTDPLLHTTTYEYDEVGRLIKTINPLGFHSGVTTYNISDNTSTVTDMLGRETVFHYDELGRVIKVVDPLGHFTTTTYDASGNVKTRTDQLGRVTQYEYDALNRLIRTIDPNGSVTETFYNAAGNRIATEDPLGHTTVYSYDELGRLVATTDPLDRVTRTEYDAFGRRAATVDAAGHRTTYTYDMLDRVIAVIDDDGNTTHTSYDALGNVLSRTDANGHTTTTIYDALNRPLVTTEANGSETTNAYDAAGNLISVTDALGHVTTYTYDALNRQKTVTDPLGNTTESFYDALGNLFDSVDANGVVTHYMYDELNRQTAVLLNHRPGVPADAETNVRYDFVYNEVGNRISVKNPNGNVTTYGYDALNRVISKSDPLDNTWSYTYDLAGNRVSATDAKNQMIQYTYDAASQLVGIDYPGTEPDVTFSYDLTGQRIGMTDGLGTTTWTYDDLSRLLSVKDAYDKTIGFGYDAVGNRTELTYPDGKTVSYVYDDVNHLTGVMDWDSQSTGYGYDAVGRLSTISRPSGVSSRYTYDNAGRLVELHHNLGMESLASYNYAYDPAGNRIQAIENLLWPSQPPTATPPTPTDTTAPTTLPTNTETDTPTATATDIATPTQTQSATDTPTVTATATSTGTPTATPTGTSTGTTEINIGETYVLTGDDSGNANVLAAQHATLSMEGTIQSLSFYVTNASGKLRLGIYSEVNGKPGTLLAKTDEFTPVAGWNTQNVQTPVLLPPGSYWLAFLPESNDLHFRYGWIGSTQTNARLYNYAYGQLPDTFSASASGIEEQFSIYATFTVLTAPGTIFVGEMNVLHGGQSGAGNMLVAQKTRLSQSAVIESLSMYVSNAVGKLRLGIYTNGVNGAYRLLAQTEEFTPINGWNTRTVQVPTFLPAGNYWLAFLPESNDLQYLYEWVPVEYTGQMFGVPFGALPATLTSQPIGVQYHYSLYATFMQDDSITFPETAILDDFDRADGPVGGNWSGTLDGFRIISKQLDPEFPAQFPWLQWEQYFGPGQEVYMTVPSISITEWIGFSLLENGPGNVIGVLYSEESHVFDIYYGNGGVYTTVAIIPHDLHDGDQFGVQVDPDGTLRIYVNGSVVATLDASGYQYHDVGGYIGLYVEQYVYNEARLDDFGGGNIGEGGMLMASASSSVEVLEAEQVAISSEFVVAGSRSGAQASLDPIFPEESSRAGQTASIFLPPVGSTDLYASLHLEARICGQTARSRCSSIWQVNGHKS